jgi:hypothetical protein
MEKVMVVVGDTVLSDAQAETLAAMMWFAYGECVGLMNEQEEAMVRSVLDVVGGLCHEDAQ